MKTSKKMKRWQERNNYQRIIPPLSFNNKNKIPLMWTQETTNNQTTKAYDFSWLVCIEEIPRWNHYDSDNSR